MVHRHPRRLLLLGPCAALTFGALAACGDDDDTGAATEAAYCTAWSDVRTAFEGFREIDVVEGGLDSVREQITSVETSLEALRTSSEELLATEAEAFRSSLDELVTTLTSTDLPVDRREEVRAATEAVDAAWNDLLVKADADCG
ncbi:MAG: hypothetical protein MUE34_09635 [Acidimicrobiales bacterium]|jgi:hypothetical protein|nr:hypothetical protein [Acidimicrobiales bacterium]